MQHKPKEQGTTALFKNPILEKLARTHISVPLTIYFIGSSLLLYRTLSVGFTTIAETVTVFVIGFVFWTWIEYLAHRHIFHMLPSSKFKEKWQYTFHGVHHEFPRDKTRIAMPPAASVIILTLLFFLFKLIMGNYAYSFLPGFVMGYSAYLGVHYAIHAFRPPKNKLNILWIHHSIHHYKDDSVAFGVSTPIWDVILGTMPRKTFKKHHPKRMELEKKHAEIAA